MFRFAACFCVSAYLATAAYAQDDDGLLARVGKVEQLGRDLNDHDQSAWHVTDVLFEAVPDARNLRIAYITERVDADHVRTVFLKMDGPAPTVFFTGVVAGSEVVSTEDFSKRADPALASAAQVAQLNAKLVVREATKSGLCGKPVNTVALPGERDGELNVYALASETEWNVMQMGGHFRVTFGADGKMLENSRRDYSTSCIALNTTKDSVGLMITLPPSISDIPTEIHVFKSLSHDIPLFVMANSKLWEVSGGEIRIGPPLSTSAN